MIKPLTAKQVADVIGCTPRTIRDKARQGMFPAPIDPRLSPVLWRWAPVAIDRYVNGDWQVAS